MMKKNLAILAVILALTAFGTVSSVQALYRDYCLVFKWESTKLKFMDRIK